MESGIKHDECGWFAWWGRHTIAGTMQRETLRTQDKARAARWLLQGNCHGASAHDQQCDDCRRGDE